MKKLLYIGALLVGMVFSASAQTNWTIGSQLWAVDSPQCPQCARYTQAETAGCTFEVRNLSWGLIGDYEYFAPVPHTYWRGDAVVTGSGWSNNGWVYANVTCPPMRGAPLITVDPSVLQLTDTNYFQYVYVTIWPTSESQ